MNIDDKVKLSNKIYPYFYGISSDLLFYIAINTMFLSVVKGYSDAQINFFTTFSIIIILVFQPINIRIIKKIGNVNSIRLGVWLLLSSAILITFSNNYYISLIGFSLYEIAFIFKSMETVLLKRNLKHFNKDNEFITIQSKGSFIYSFITMIISLIAGFLFTINNYLPMYLCIMCCMVNIVLSHLLYESDTKEEVVTKKKFDFSKVITLILLTYAICISVVSLAQSNSKLFIQKDMINLLGIETTSIYLVVVVAISRVVRVISNLIFPRIYKKIKDKVLLGIIVLTILSFVFILYGNIISSSLIGIYIMCIGYYVYLFVRDPLQNYIKSILLNSCKREEQPLAITYLELSKNMIKFLISLAVTLILLKFDLSVVFNVFLLISIVELFIGIKLYKLVSKKM